MTRPASAVRRLRSRGFAAPVCVIADVAALARVATLLEAGADEYIRAPYDPVELIARLRALLRRSHG